jgi:RNA:NAD 2'-phosphotransferase (TPT1/KptA family)
LPWIVCSIQFDERTCDILAGVQAVRRDNKQRFSLLEEDGELLIRANQGHTVTVCSLPEISCTDSEVVYTKHCVFTMIVHFPFNIFVRWK